MRPDGFRTRLGFALCGAATLTLLTAVPSLAQGLSSSQLMGAVPLAVALGAGAFAMLAIALIRSIRRDGQLARHKASGQIASLRALVDDYEALLSSASEITIVWTGREAPQFFGPASAVLPQGRRVEAVLDFEDWLNPGDAGSLTERLAGLRTNGQGFDTLVTARDGRNIRAQGCDLVGQKDEGIHHDGEEQRKERGQKPPRAPLPELEQVDRVVGAILGE